MILFQSLKIVEPCLSPLETLPPNNTYIVFSFFIPRCYGRIGLRGPNRFAHELNILDIILLFLLCYLVFIFPIVLEVHTYKIIIH